MKKQYEDELICDMAESYRIYDYRALKARYAATLALGLRPHSRVMLKIREDSREDAGAFEKFLSPEEFFAARQKIIKGG